MSERALLALCHHSNPRTPENLRCWTQPARCRLLRAGGPVCCISQLTHTHTQKKQTTGISQICVAVTNFLPHENTHHPILWVSHSTQNPGSTLTSRMYVFDAREAQNANLTRGSTFLGRSRRSLIRTNEDRTGRAARTCRGLVFLHLFRQLGS